MSVQTQIVDRLQSAITWFKVFLDAQARYCLLKGLIKRGTVKMGRHSYGCIHVHWYTGSERRVIIGNFTSIARDVTVITGGTHPVDWVSTYPFRINWHLPGAREDGLPSTNGDVVIGSDVWIAEGATILSGVTIGDGAVVCARAVVVKDVPPYAIVGGVPSKVIRSRFPPPVVEALLRIRWWDWSDEEIRGIVPLLSSPDMQNFLEYCSKRQDKQLTKGETT
jgi:chloramphenicol O-acetyltransferase type B